MMKKEIDPADKVQLWPPVTDPARLAERKAEWRLVKTNLDRMTGYLKKSVHKYHKELFFYGTMLDERRFYSIDYDWLSAPFADALPLFQLWYHPGDPAEVYRAIYEQQWQGGGLEEARRLLFALQATKFADGYGMLGGREPYAVKMLLPGLDYKETREFSESHGKFSMALPPRITCIEWTNGGTYFLHRSMLENPFLPGLYLWEHMNFAVDKYWHDVEADGRLDRTMAAFHRRFRELLAFNDHSEPHWDGERAQQRRDELVEKFETGQCCARLQDFWGEAKKAYDAGDPIPHQIEDEA